MIQGHNMHRQGHIQCAKPFHPRGEISQKKGCIKTQYRKNTRFGTAQKI